MSSLFKSKKGLDYSIRQAVLSDLDNGLFDCLSELSQITWDRYNLREALLEREQTGCIFTCVAVTKSYEWVESPYYFKKYIIPPPGYDVPEYEYKLVEKIIGTGSLILERKFIHDTKRVGHIEDVVVKEEYRGHGIGEQLVKFLVDFAKGFKAYKVILNCNQNNIPFYEKCGFKKCEEAMRLDIV